MRGPDLTRHALLLAAATLLVACNDPSSTDSPYIVTPVTTTTLSGTPGRALTDTLAVEVRDYEGNLVLGAKVTWSLPQGEGSGSNWRMPATG